MPAKTSSPAFLSAGSDSPVMVASLNEPWPLTNDAVRGHVVSGADADDVADDQFAGGHFFLAAVRFEAARPGGREFDERFNGQARALGGAGFNDFAGEHEKGNDAGDLVIARRERGEHGDGDQFIDAEAADAQILDGGDDDGVAQNNRAEAGAGAGHAAALSEQPIHHVGVDDEHNPHDGLPQMHHRMFVVVAGLRLRVRDGSKVM